MDGIELTAENFDTIEVGQRVWFPDEDFGGRSGVVREVNDEVLIVRVFEFERPGLRHDLYDVIVAKPPLS